MFPIISHLLFQDRFMPPRQGTNGDPQDGTHCVRGPEAWLDGLRQKGWTLATVVLILIASWSCGTTASLLGQGDNQVILLRLPSKRALEQREQTVEDYIDYFLHELNDLCDKAGIVIKTQESWYSRKLLEYGRKYYFEGAQVSCGLKKVSRLTSEANQTLPTLNTLLSGMFACGASCANEDYSPIPSYMCTIIEATLLMYTKYPWMEQRDVFWMSVVWCMSRSVGGYPISLFPQFITRSVQDPLSTNLHLLKTLLHHPEFHAHVRSLVNLGKPANVDHISLIKDPPSIPLIQPPQPENMIRNKIKEGLGSIIKNQQVAYLFTRESSLSEETLKTDILAITPHHPKLMNRLWQLSNLGQQEKVLGKFSSSRSIQRAALNAWVNESDLLKGIAALEARQERRFCAPPPSDPAPLILLHACSCVTRYTQHLRETLWGVRLEGITMAPMQELLTVKSWDEVSLEEQPSAIYVECHSRLGSDMFATRGPCTPYIGSQTKLRSRRSALQVMEVGSLVESVKMLMELRSWLKGNEAMVHLIDKLIQEKTDLSVEQLEQYTNKVYSGLLTHRLPCPALRRGGMLNMNSTICSWLRVISDTALHYAKQSTNYNLCWQEIFLTGLARLANLYDEAGTLKKRHSMIISKKCCVWELPPEKFELSTSVYSPLSHTSYIHHLTPTEDRYLIDPRNIADPVISYSIYMALVDDSV